MIKKTTSISFLFIALFFFSCRHETITPVNVGYKYFPVNVGHWVSYEVDSTVWDDFYSVTDPQHIRKYHFYIKEIVESTFLDNQNRPTQRLERYKKTDSTDWLLKNVWVLNLTKTTAEKVEENIRYVKLIFPIVEGQTWDGNAFNIFDTIGPQNYEYSEIFEPATVNGITFDSTVTVNQKIDSNAVEAFNQYEIFARNVGMVYKRYCSVLIDVYTQKIKSGVDYTYKFISYGN